MLKGPRLFLPEKPAFPNILKANEHVIYFSAGESVFTDFLDETDPCLSNEESGVTFAIPLLTDKPRGGLPQYSLALGILYDRHNKQIDKPNLIIPYLPVDELTLNDTILFLRNGTDEMLVKFQRNNNPCKPVTSLVRHEAEEFLEVDLQFGLPEPNFEVCDDHDHYDNPFCSTVRAIKCEVSRSAPNICQLPWRTSDQHACDATIEVINVTPGFRKLMCLSDDEPVRLLATESRKVIARIGLRYPCI